MQAEKAATMQRGVSNAVRFACAVVLTFGLTGMIVGCVKVKDVLTLNADGSGSVDIETVSYLGDFAGGMDFSGEMLSSGQPPYPPIFPGAAKQLFPPEDFTVKVEQKKTAAGEPMTVVKATFKDVNRLLASPYAKAHSLWMGLDAQKLTVKALTGLQTLSTVESMPNTEEFMGPGIRAKDIKEKMQKLHVDFAITLPAAPKAEGAVVDGNTATWTVDRAAINDAAKTAIALRTAMTASCAADAVKFKPVSPVRLDLAAFADLKEGPTGEKVPAMDTEKVRAAAKFAPLFFQSTRGFDLAGEGYHQESQASLMGVMVLPVTLAPQTWGRVELTEATDDQGASLVPKEKQNDYDRWGYMNMGRRMYAGLGPDGKPKPQTEVRHVIAIPMKPPLPSVKALRQVQASIELRYPGIQHVIKVKSVVKTPPPPPEGKKAAVGVIVGRQIEPQGNEETVLSHPKLDEFGVKLSINGVWSRMGTMSISLRRSGRGALLTDVQVFDAKGNPWPTFSHGMDGDADDYSTDITVTGQPEGPLSIALVVDAGGPTVKVPIVLHDLPILPNEMKERPDKGDNPDEGDEGGLPMMF